MRIRHLALACAFALASLAASAQKKPLTHNVYDGWNDMERPQISLRGNLVTFEINPQDGDGLLVVTSSQRSFEKTIERGTSALLHPEGQFVGLIIKPTKADVRKAKIDKKKPDQMPKDSGGVYFPYSDEWIGFSKVKSMELGRKGGDWIGVLADYKPEKAKETEKKDSLTAEPKKKLASKSKAKNKRKDTKLTLLDTKSRNQQHFVHVDEFAFSEKGRWVAIAYTSGDTLENNILNLFNTSTGTPTELMNGKGEFKNLAFSPDEKLLAFHFTADTGKVKVYDLYLWAEGDKAPKPVLYSGSSGIPSGWVVSHHQSPRFSTDSKRLFLHTYPKPAEEPKDTLPADEKVIFDLWSWTDTLIQTQQKVNLKSDLKKSFQGVYTVKSGKYLQLATRSMENVRIDREGVGAYAIGVDRSPYQWSMTWEYPSGADYYLVDIETGNRRVIARNSSSFPMLSPNQKYIAFYQPSDSAWYGMTTKDLKSFPLTQALSYNLFDEQNDEPSQPSPYGAAGWLTDGQSLLIYDRYDIWKVDLTQKNQPICITNGNGRTNRIRYRYQRLETEKEGIPHNQPMLVNLFDENDKSSGFAQVNLASAAIPQVITKQPYRYGVVGNSDDLATLLWTRQSYQEYPDLWVSQSDFAAPLRLCQANPQQEEYLWGRVELTRWTDFNRQEIEGLLYLPENFDSSQQYPMMVYFYDRHSDELHTHHKPAPGRSVICPTYYVSNGYVVFMPDIAYTEGLPGRSAYDAIISGTMALVNRGFVNKDRIGVQGQSWGGYQIAYLVTQTDLFKAASAGAPVSNMTSAYGGIRWGSGLSRMFQYERTQSRIGASLWERPMHFIENSPLFYAPRVKTPLLIRHDDADEAVPWYQGIEYFLALRRLNKPVWMINYNDEAHNLVRRANRVDWTIRMQQFFDHYLKDAPAPHWLKYGIPATDKGKMRYELTEP